MFSSGCLLILHITVKPSVVVIPPPESESEVLSCNGIKLNGSEKTRLDSVLLSQKSEVSDFCFTLAIAQLLNDFECVT